MAYFEINCNSFSEYIQLVIGWANNNNWVVFRGQSDVDYKLNPGIARNVSTIGIANTLALEQELHTSFKITLNDHILQKGINKADNLEILTFAQHLGVKTRLLDWSANPLVAIYFAIKELSERMLRFESLNGNFCVWALCLEDDDSRQIHQLEQRRDIVKNPFIIEKTYFFKPSRITDRFNTQASYFTLHHCHPKKGFVALEDNNEYRNDLAKIIFPKNLAIEIRDSLDILHINEAQLFPEDFSARARHLQWKIERSWYLKGVKKDMLSNISHNLPPSFNLI